MLVLGVYRYLLVAELNLAKFGGAPARATLQFTLIDVASIKQGMGGLVESVKIAYSSTISEVEGENSVKKTQIRVVDDSLPPSRFPASVRVTSRVVELNVFTEKNKPKSAQYMARRRIVIEPPKRTA